MKEKSIVILFMFLFLFEISYGSIGIGVIPAKVNVNKTGLQTISLCLWNEGENDIEVCGEGEIFVLSPNCSMNEYVKIDANTTLQTCKKVDFYVDVRQSGYIYIKAKPYGSGTANVVWSVGVFVNYTSPPQTTTTTTTIRQEMDGGIYGGQTTTTTIKPPQTTTIRPPTTTTQRPNITTNQTTTTTTIKPNVTTNQTTTTTTTPPIGNYTEEENVNQSLNISNQTVEERRDANKGLNIWKAIGYTILIAVCFGLVLGFIYYVLLII